MEAGGPNGEEHKVPERQTAIGSRAQFILEGGSSNLLGGQRLLEVRVRSDNGNTGCDARKTLQPLIECQQSPERP